MKKRTIPTIFALILLLTGAFVGVVFLDQDTGFLPRAAPEFTPENVRITNQTDTSFTISWTTQEPTTGFVKLGTAQNKLDLTFTDDRDQLSGSNESFRTHHVSTANLEPDTTYYYKIGSQSNKTYDNNGQPYQVVTSKSLSTESDAQVITGTVLSPAQTPADGALVYLAVADSSPLSSLAKQNGSFAFDVSKARNQDLSILTIPKEGIDTMNLLINDGSNPTSSLTIPFTTKLLDPIIIGQTQSIITQNAINPTPTPQLPEVIPVSKFTFEDIQTPEATDSSSISVDSIPEDGFVTVETQPLFEGTAPANQTINITVHSSNAYFDSVSTDESGEWSWQPPGELEPGPHELTVTYVDEAGVLQTHTRSFVVASATATASQPAYTATPSATLNPTPTLEQTPSPTRIATPTPVVRSSMPSTSSAIPVSGTGYVSLTLALSGLILILFGLIGSKLTFFK